jgi:acyl dehydratase
VGLYFEEFDESVEYVSRSRTVTEADVVNFAGISGDYNPLHTDAEFMKSSRFGERIAHGMLVASMSTGLSNQRGWFEGTTIALLEMNFRFKEAVRFGDTLHLVLKVKEKRETKKQDQGVLVVAADMINQRDEIVMEGQWTALMKRRPS